MCRYGSGIDYVMAADVETGLSLIVAAIKGRREERVYQQWVAQLPAMAILDTPMSYEEYRDRVTGANIDTRPTEEILQELDGVEQQFAKEEGVNGS